MRVQGVLGGSASGGFRGGFRVVSNGFRMPFNGFRPSGPKNCHSFYRSGLLLRSGQVTLYIILEGVNHTHSPGPPPSFSRILPAPIFQFYPRRRLRFTRSQTPKSEFCPPQTVHQAEAYPLQTTDLSIFPTRSRAPGGRASPLRARSARKEELQHAMCRIQEKTPSCPIQTGGHFT